MVRIKTILKNGNEFLSPFVFTEDQAEKKIRSIKRWHQWQGWPEFETVEVKKHHPLTLWKEEHPIFDHFVTDQVGMIERLENTWRVI